MRSQQRVDVILVEQRAGQNAGSHKGCRDKKEPGRSGVARVKFREEFLGRFDSAPSQQEHAPHDCVKKVVVIAQDHEEERQ